MGKNKSFWLCSLKSFILQVQQEMGSVLLEVTEWIHPLFTIRRSPF